MPRGVKNGTRREVGTGDEYTTGDIGGDETGISGTGEDSGETIDSGGIFIDPTEIGGGNKGNTEDLGFTAAGTPRKRRPKGFGKSSTTSKKKVSTTLEGLENILLSVHMMGASIVKCPELELDPKEAASMSAAIARVAALYDIEASEATLAWVNLAVVVGPIYAFRFFAIKARLAQESEEAKRKNLRVMGQ